MPMLAKVRGLFGFKDKEIAKELVVAVAEPRVTKNAVLGFLASLKTGGFGLGSWHSIREEDREIVELLERYSLVCVDVGRKNVRVAMNYSCDSCVNFVPRKTRFEYNRCAWSKGNLSQMLNPQHGRSCSGFLNKTIDGLLKRLG